MIHRLSLFAALLVLTSSLTLSAQPQGAPVYPVPTIYVDLQNVNGPWRGSTRFPFLDINQALTDPVYGAVDGDVIFVRPGTYVGAGNRDLDFSGLRVYLYTFSAVIDCQQAGRAFDFNSGEGNRSVVRGFTILNGLPSTTSPFPGFGGAVICRDSSSPKFIACQFQNCRANQGGAVYCLNSSPKFADCVFTGNWAGVTAAGFGGAVDIRCDAWKVASPVFTNCTFTGNWVNGGNGGAVRSGGTATTNATPRFAGCTFTGNTAINAGALMFSFSSGQLTDSTLSGNAATTGGGGAVGCNESTPLISGCQILGNTAMTYGGGLYCIERVAPNVTSILDTVISNNTALFGGGVAVYDANLAFYRCNVDDNDLSPLGAGTLGGGIHCVESDLVFEAGSIRRNKAENGGGIFCGNESSPEFRSGPIGFPLYIEQNVAAAGGGAAYVQHGAPTFKRCWIRYNTAGGNGGGLHFAWTYEDYFADVVNSQFKGNVASGGSGGGVYLGGKIGQLVRLAVNFSTFIDNYAGQSGNAMYNKYPGNYPHIFIKNSVLWGTIMQDVVCNVSWAFQTAHCDFQQGPISGNGGNISEDPEYRDTEGRLSESSPCVNTAQFYSNVNRDLDGLPRPSPAVGGVRDMGAFEYQF